MQFLGLVALIGLFLSIVDASAASADQCPARESPIVTDRPDVTNSSLVVPRGSFQSENGINFSQRGGSHEFDGTESRLRWGVVPCLEVLIHGGPSYLFNSGAGYRITPTQQIDLHIGIGLNDRAPAYIVGIGYSFRHGGLF